MAALNSGQTLVVMLAALASITILGVVGVFDAGAIERLVTAIVAGAIGLGLPSAGRRVAALRTSSRTTKV